MPHVIKDVPKDEWKEKVWDVMIVPDEKFLYKKPGYTCDESPICRE